MSLSISQNNVLAGPDPDYHALTTLERRREYFRKHGYLVHRAMIDEGLCRRAITCFEEEIKTHSGYLYRQASANPERHLFNDAGNVLNSLLNPLSVDGRRFPRFRAVSEEILSGDRLFEAVEELYGETAVLVQSMYFEGNPATWPHQDCYYLDAEPTGMLLGAWIALEDIPAEAGRFYVCPGSQHLDIARNSGNMSISRDHERYKRKVYDKITRNGIECRAPALRRGDVVLWSSRTIHGATEPTDHKMTRNSYTAHFIPASSRFIQYQCIPVILRPEQVAGHAICRPKDQAKRLNRWIFSVETLAPKTFRLLKRKTIAWKIRRMNGDRVPA